MLANTYSLNVPVPHVFAKDGRAVTSSLDVAGYFNKPHKDVLEKIRNLLETRPQLGERNFSPSSYNSIQGRELPAYLMDRKGFTLLVFGFTGPRALDFKIAYIDAFEAMEARLKELTAAAIAAQQPGLDKIDIENLKCAYRLACQLTEKKTELDKIKKDLRKTQRDIEELADNLINKFDVFSTSINSIVGQPLNIKLALGAVLNKQEHLKAKALTKA